MARLTWDSVRGPDFSGISDSYRTMSSLLGNAVQGGLGMIDTVRDTNSQAADRAIMARLAGVQDPSQFNAASIIGADAANASASTLQAVGNRPGTLLDWATSRNNLEESQYGFSRTKAANDILDNPANRDAIAQARTLAATDLAGAQRILSGLGLRTDQFASVFADLEQSATSALNRESTQQRLDQNDYTQSRTERTDSITDQVEAGRAYLAKNAADPEHAEQLLWRQGYGPEVINRLLGSAAGGGSGAGGTPGGADPSRIMNYEARASGFNAVPDSVKTLGQASDFALTVNGGNRARTGTAGSSAMGLYQIVGSTMRSYGPKVFGDSWKDMEFTPANQDKLAEAIFNDNKGTASALSKQWVSLSPAEAERVRQMPWAQAREVIAQKESGATGAQLNTLLTRGNQQVTNANVMADIQRAGGMANSGSLNQRLAAMEGQDVDMPTLTKSLTADGGPLAGYTQGEIANEIRAIAGAAKISNAQAAEILKENYVPRNGALRALSAVVPFAKLAENTFDRKMNLETARQYSAGGLSTIDQNNSRTVAGQTLGQVQQQAQALDAQIAAAAARYQVTQSPEIQQRVEQLRGQRAMLDPVLQELMDQQQNDPNLTSRDFAAEIATSNARAASEAKSAERLAAQNRWVNTATQSSRYIPDFIP